MNSKTAKLCVQFKREQWAMCHLQETKHQLEMLRQFVEDVKSKKLCCVGTPGYKKTSKNGKESTCGGLAIVYDPNKVELKDCLTLVPGRMMVGRMKFTAAGL